MLEHIEIIILGIVQGIAEFLPISSSAHLIIFRDFLGVGRSLINTDLDLVFDIALHFGTLMTILIFFFKDFWKMFIKGITKGTKDKDGKLFWLIVAATIPAALMGIIFEDAIDGIFRKQFILIGLSLIVMGIILNHADRKGKESKGLYDINIGDSLFIGFSQILALIPGFSRSGTTIAASRAHNISREASTKFSFYLATPIILGATTLQAFKTDFAALKDYYFIFFIGILVSFTIGILSIKFLLKYIKTNDFRLFMWYRIIVGVSVIAYSIFKLL